MSSEWISPLNRLTAHIDGTPKKWGKGKFMQVRAILDKFRQLWASLVNLGQVRTRQQIRKMEKRGRKTKKKE